MDARIAICLSLLLSACLLSVESRDLRTKPATPNFENLFKGRCAEYQFIMHKELLKNRPLSYCSDLWKAFSEAYINKPSCDAPEKVQNYTKFLQLAKNAVNKPYLLYSSVKDTAKDLARQGKDYFNMESTLAGYLLDNTHWCGRGEKQCQAKISRKHLCAVKAYWLQASVFFASQEVAGEVTVLLDGSWKEPFSKRSVLGSLEVVNFNNKKVTKVIAVLKKNLPDYFKAGQTCKSESLQAFRSMMKKKKIPFVCHNFSREVIAQQCSIAQGEDGRHCSRLFNEPKLSAGAPSKRALDFEDEDFEDGENEIDNVQ